MAAAVVPTALAPSTHAGNPSSHLAPALPAPPRVLLRRPSLGSLPPTSSSSSLSAKRRQQFGVSVRATTSQEDATVPDASKQLQELFDELKAKYDALENKSQVWLYGGGVLLALWISSIIVGAVNSIPVLPKMLEFVGLCYSGWFVYRYILFKSSRKQLADDIEELKLKITGSPKIPLMTDDDD